MNFSYFAFALMSLVTSVFAQGGDKPGGFGFGSFLPMMLVMFGIIYFFMIRPEQRKQKEKRSLIGNLKKGDKVLTIGGIYGTVGNVKDDTVMLRIADNTTVKANKSAISTVVNKEEGTKKIIEEKKA